MNLYLVSYFNWDDSEDILLYHEQDYSDAEFKRFCEEAYETVGCPYPVGMAEYLVEHYDFKYPHVKRYYTNDNNIKIIEKGYI